MNAIKVNRLALLSIVRKNRQIHANEYEESMKGFRVLLEEKLRKMLEDVTERQVTPNSMYIDLEVPKSHLCEYDDVIGILELGTEHVVDLDMGDYRRLVKDEWQWTEIFKSNHRTYYAVSQTGFSN